MKKQVRNAEKSIIIQLLTFFWRSTAPHGQTRGEARWWWWFELVMNTRQRRWSQFRHYPSHAEPKSDFRNTRFSTIHEVLYLSKKLLNSHFWIWNKLSNWPISRSIMTSFLLLYLPIFNFSISQRLATYYTPRESPEWGEHESEIRFWK